LSASLQRIARDEAMRSSTHAVERKKDMDKRFELIGTSVAALGALTVVAIATPASARTYEYCRRDIIGNVLSCSFDTLAQCQAMSSGRGGDCLHDPSLSDIASTYAYAPDRRVKARTRRQ